MAMAAWMLPLPPHGIPYNKDSTMSNHIKDGSGETVIDLSDYGEERAAKAAEYVFLQGVFTPPQRPTKSKYQTSFSRSASG